MRAALKPLQRRVFDLATDGITLTAEQLADIAEDCARLNAAECQQNISAFTE